MSGSYRPRDWCEAPAHFGRVPAAKWREPKAGAEAAQQVASRMQHRFSINIQTRLGEKNWSITEYCTRSGISYDRFIRVLNGQRIMRLEDLGMAQAVLGQVFAFATAEELRKREQERTEGTSR